MKKTGKLPVVNFAAGGVATPADAALCMQLGVDGVFVGSGIFKSSAPARRARAIVKAVTHFNDPQAGLWSLDFGHVSSYILEGAPASLNITFYFQTFQPPNYL